MQGATVHLRHFVGGIVASVLILTLAYVYVISFSVGWKLVAVVIAGILFFFMCGLFVRRLRSFLLFALIFCISLGYGYYLTFQPVTEFESQPFTVGVRIEVVDVVLALLYAHWALRAAGNRMQPSRLTLGNPFGTILLIWIIYALVSAWIYAGHFKYSVYSAIDLLKGFMLFFYLVNNISDKRDVRLVIYALFASTLAHALYICFQYITGLNYPLQGEFPHFLEHEDFRASGFFGTWDGAAIMLAVVIPVGLAYCLVMEDPWKLRLVMPGLGIVFLAMLFTKTRAAWGATIVSSAMVIWLTYFRDRVSTKGIVKAVAAIAIPAALAIPFAAHRFVTGAYGEDRLPLVYTAVEMIRNNWLLGTGLGNYVFHMQKYVPPGLSDSWSYTVHNEYLLWMAETGLLGFTLYYLLLGLVIATFWKLSRSADQWTFVVSAGLCAAMIASLPNRMLSIYAFTPIFTQYCMVLALASVLRRLEKDRLRTTEPWTKP